jgi:hypothetical protein
MKKEFFYTTFITKFNHLLKTKMNFRLIFLRKDEFKSLNINIQQKERNFYLNFESTISQIKA